MSYTIFLMCVYIYLLIFPLRLSAIVSSVWEGSASQFLLLEYWAENKISSPQQFQRGQRFRLGHSRWLDSTVEWGVVSIDKSSALAVGQGSGRFCYPLPKNITSIHRGNAMCQALG